MSKEEFITLCDEMNVKYTEAKDAGWPQDYDGVYVTGEPVDTSYGKFTPYLRVSGFEDDNQYVRDCGLVGFRDDAWLEHKLKEFAR